MFIENTNRSAFWSRLTDLRLTSGDLIEFRSYQKHITFLYQTKISLKFLIFLLKDKLLLWEMYLMHVDISNDCWNHNNYCWNYKTKHQYPNDIGYMTFLWMPIRSTSENRDNIESQKSYYWRNEFFSGSKLWSLSTLTPILTFPGHNDPIQLKEAVKDLKHTATLLEEF